MENNIEEILEEVKTDEVIETEETVAPPVKKKRTYNRKTTKQETKKEVVKEEKPVVKEEITSNEPTLCPKDLKIGERVFIVNTDKSIEGTDLTQYKGLTFFVSRVCIDTVYVSRLKNCNPLFSVNIKNIKRF